MVYVNPDPWDNAPAVIVDSDAPTNLQAIREVSEWANLNGFARTTESHLRQIYRDGRMMYQAVYFRLTEEFRAGVTERLRQLDERLSRMPVHVTTEG